MSHKELKKTYASHTPPCYCTSANPSCVTICVLLIQKSVYDGLLKPQGGQLPVVHAVSMVSRVVVVQVGSGCTEVVQTRLTTFYYSLIPEHETVASARRIEQRLSDGS